MESELTDLKTQGWTLSAALKNKELRGMLLRHTNPENFAGIDETIYRAIQAQKNEHIDTLDLEKRVMKTGKERLIKIDTDFSGMPANPKIYEGWLNDVKRLAINRQSRVHLRTVAAAIAPESKADDIISQVVTGLMAIRQQNQRKGLSGVREGVQGSRARIAAYKAGDRFYGRIPTGFSEIDWRSGGIPRREITLLAARPGHGKSALAGMIARNAALRIQAEKRDAAVCLFSLEMSADLFTDRLASAGSGVNEDDIRDGIASPEDEQKFQAALDRVESLDRLFKIDDSAGQTTGHIATECLVEAAQHKDGIELIVVDYGGLLCDKPLRGESTTDRVGRMLRNLKTIARTHDCALLLVWQLNRGPESRDDRKPILADLRDSGNLEQDAYQIIFLMRPIEYTDLVNGDLKYQTSTIRNLIDECGEEAAFVNIAKNRGGGKKGVTAVLSFTPELKRFYEKPKTAKAEEVNGQPPEWWAFDD